MKKHLLNSLYILTAVIGSCQSRINTENTASMTVMKTPEEMIKETDLNISKGDSLVIEIDSTEESLEGGEDVAYFNPDSSISKIKKSNFGETYQNEDIFYFTQKGKIFAITSETFRYNRSTYEESSVPMEITSEGKFRMTFDSTGKLLTYLKVNNKRKMEEKFIEKEEHDYWLKRGEKLFATYKKR